MQILLRQGRHGIVLGRAELRHKGNTVLVGDTFDALRRRIDNILLRILRHALLHHALVHPVPTEFQKVLLPGHVRRHTHQRAVRLDGRLLNQIGTRRHGNQRILVKQPAGGLGPGRAALHRAQLRHLGRHRADALLLELLELFDGLLVRRAAIDEILVRESNLTVKFLLIFRPRLTCEPGGVPGVARSDTPHTVPAARELRADAVLLHVSPHLQRMIRVSERKREENLVHVTLLTGEKPVALRLDQALDAAGVDGHRAAMRTVGVRNEPRRERLRLPAAECRIELAARRTALLAQRRRLPALRTALLAQGTAHRGIRSIIRTRHQLVSHEAEYWTGQQISNRNGHNQKN